MSNCKGEWYCMVNTGILQPAWVFVLLATFSCTDLHCLPSLVMTGAGGRAGGCGGQAAIGLVCGGAGSSRDGGAAAGAAPDVIDVGSDSSSDLPGAREAARAHAGAHPRAPRAAAACTSTSGQLGQEECRTAVEQLMEMGFSEHKAGRALAHAQGDVGKAAEWLLQHAEQGR